MKKLFSLLLFFFLVTGASHPAAAQLQVMERPAPGAFRLATTAGATAIYVEEQDHWLVQKAAAWLQQDIKSLTGVAPAIVHDRRSSYQQLIIIGSIDSSKWGRQLAPDSLKGKWEAYSLRTIDRPAPNIAHALVITGSDRRGTAYGVLELSRALGVSPWYWWADVPVPSRRTLYLRKGTQLYSAPAVKYRGFFINDEAPALSGWAKKTFGGLNHLFYEKVFELLLRMKANYLWPAMWGNAFNDDDKLNPVLADQYGIVMGTSHHEPMLRAQQEWKRYGSGPWNYEQNATVLDSFWRQGIEHMGTHESIVTIGMRGDGDMPMTEGSNIQLLEKIVNRQRRILSDVTGKPPAATPQLWALYKEVQDYYDKGMRVPEDVTLLLCDDNWGNIRKLPRLIDPVRPGGYGIYYHFDYVGDPRNYKWLNTNPLPRVWEQMHLAWSYGVDRIWIVNVGDIKPMELPTQFFLDYAWDPAQWPANSLHRYVQQWAAQQFGPAFASAIGEILEKYAFYNGRKKPELLSPDTYSLTHYHEAATIVHDYNQLAKTADSIYQLLPAAYRDAYYQLVLYPVQACANLNDLYVTVALNRFYAAQGQAVANTLAIKARQLYERDSLLSHYYNTTMANGKWDHMMDQTHIGYTYWQQPPVNTMPSVNIVASPGTNVNTADITFSWPADSSSGGSIALEAAHYNRSIDGEGNAINGDVKWLCIPGLGRTCSGMEGDPVTVSARVPGGNSPRLEYQMTLQDTGLVQVQAYFSPALPFNGKPLHYAISFDDETLQIIDITTGYDKGAGWEKMVADNIRIATSQHLITRRGQHVLKYWMVDPAVVLQKIVVNTGGEKPSYLGPPASCSDNAVDHPHR